jgi:hypothetical protein
MSEWEPGPGFLWVLTVLLAVARLGSDEQTDRPSHVKSWNGTTPATCPARGSHRSGWPPGASPSAPPRPPGLGQPAYPLAA